ncbi:MAG: D-2-hydroxyacid dehydrogenase [Planctomycetota bacterium]
MRIVLCYPVEGRHKRQIQQAAPNAEIVDAGQERIAEELLDADIYCGHAKVPVPWEEVTRRGRLQWIQSSAAGLDHCLVPPVVAAEDIVVSSASGVLAKQVLDHAFALLTGTLRSLPAFFAATQKREFIRRPTRDLYGSTAAVIGLGGNGRLIAKTLRAFDVKVLATDWFPEANRRHADEVLPPEGLDDILPRADAVILAAPLTEHTRGIIDARRLALMKPEAVLVNVARGPLVVEADLVEALQSGRLWGAGLDVTEIEPLPQESPLWEAPRTLITPHVGGQRTSRIDDMTELFCRNIDRFFAKKALINGVNKRLGFPAPEAILEQQGREQ